MLPDLCALLLVVEGHAPVPPRGFFIALNQFFPYVTPHSPNVSPASFSLHKCLPPDIHTRASGRMHITVTEVRERFCILTSNVAVSPEQWLTLLFEPPKRGALSTLEP